MPDNTGASLSPFFDEDIMVLSRLYLLHNIDDMPQAFYKDFVTIFKYYKIS